MDFAVCDFVWGWFRRHLKGTSSSDSMGLPESEGQVHYGYNYLNKSKIKHHRVDEVQYT